MYRSLIFSFAALAAAVPAPVQQRDAAPSPTLITFTYLSQLVTATYYGTSTVANPPCPTQTFTYQGVGITIPYTGPGTPQSCLTPAGDAASTAQPAPETTVEVTTSCPPVSTAVVGGGSKSSPVATSEAAASTTPAVIVGTQASSAPANSAPAATSSVPAVDATTAAAQAPSSSAEAQSSSTPSLSAAQAPSSTSAAPSQSSIAPGANTITKGFNYGSSGQTLQTFESSFTLAQSLVGTSGFSSARLYTMVQDGTANDPISAIQAAINTKTTLLLGLFWSSNPTYRQNELTALSRSIAQYGSQLADIVNAISVGSEDLYRNSPTGIAAKSNEGANPSDIVDFIASTRAILANTPLADKMVGHVDTWTAYVNGSNAAVISACDFLGMDAYPYYQNTQANAVSSGRQLLEAAYDATVGVAQGKSVWITETGWPVAGPTENLAVTGTSQAETYWQTAGCDFAFGKIPTYWYELTDASSPVNFAVTSGSTTPLYDLSCPA